MGRVKAPGIVDGVHKLGPIPAPVPVLVVEGVPDGGVEASGLVKVVPKII
jgi:hypothetical protein